ncbi:MAG: PAS domain S-box protein, partial [Pseudomonadota bacterium]
MQPDPPVRYYGTEDGLNQAWALNLAIDQSGYIWTGTFAGINRFDGETMQSYTTQDGLRDNFVQSMLVDSRDRIWAGDASGGLTRLDGAVVAATYTPPAGGEGRVLALAEFDNHVYLGRSPGGLSRVSLEDDGQIKLIDGGPPDIIELRPYDDGRLLVMAESGTFFYNPYDASWETLTIESPIGAAERIMDGTWYVGSQDGRVGILTDTIVEWLPNDYGDSIFGLVIVENQLQWVMTREQMIAFDSDTGSYSQNSQMYALYDPEGVLWTAGDMGLGRHLGPRFRHYTIETGDVATKIFSVAIDEQQRFWLGTSAGVLLIEADGKILNLTERDDLPELEVRELLVDNEGKTVRAVYMDGYLSRVNTESLVAESVYPDESDSFTNLIRDAQGVLWAGSYNGRLHRFDPVTETGVVHQFADTSSVYAMAAGSDDTLWFAANFDGLYRVSTLDANAQPERIVSTEQLGAEVFSQIIVKRNLPGEEDVLWISTAKNGVLRVTGDQVEHLVTASDVDGKPVYWLHPLSDGTLVMGTSRGVYRRDLQSGRTDFYGPLQGFVGIENASHGYIRDEDTLWIGSGTGLTRMDLSLPMDDLQAPRINITEFASIDGVIKDVTREATQLPGPRASFRFKAITTLRPGHLEYSYRLLGESDTWSEPADTRSVDFSKLAPGEYTFEVRARRPDGEWSLSAKQSFVVPTPFWMTTWFRLLGILAFGSIVWLGVRWRLAAIKRLNATLRKQIYDVEARFSQAYENAPIGIGLVDSGGMIYDANPSLKALFWPRAEAEDRERLVEIVAEDQRDEFLAFLQAATASDAQYEQQFECVADDGRHLLVNFKPSVIRRQDGGVSDIVMIAHDVTEQERMTRKLEFQARYDELTGLVNRREFAGRLQNLASQPGFMMFIDLDQFKIVNDSCGHAAGDEL